jgi:beta-glucosidase
LSYTSFNYTNAKLSKTTISKNESVTLTVEVQNTGKIEGDEVVQVYLKNPNDKNAPIKALKGFKRVAIKAGESRKVNFVLNPKSFYSFDDNSQKQVLLSGKYELLYGGSSDDKSLKKTIINIL